MCGIGGVLMKNGSAPDIGALNLMRDALSQRGIDGSGTFVDGSIGFIHTRLSIIDGEGGRQPLTDYKGRTIVFNGEIYNYIEIKQSLHSEYSFKTNSDTETILALYDKYGLGFVEKLRGMYAIAIYDPEFNRLIIARDAFGIKPLYMVENDNILAFASEPKALINAGFATNDINLNLLRQVIKKNYISASQTPYPAIDRLPMGAMLVYENGVRVSCNFRDTLSPLPPIDMDEDVAISQLDSILNDSVFVHCRSDVGYGVFLSGGVDSTVITRIISRGLLGDNRINAYNAYFDMDSAADEREYARAVAQSCSANLNEVMVGIDDFRVMLPKIAAYMDDPVADYAVIPTWKLASVAAHEQKVVLCGEGGDELFAGYGRYRTRWWKDWRGLFEPNNIVTSPNWSRIQCNQAKDIFEYLPNDLLIKLDTCLMAHGLEGRTPFLDMDVATFAFHLPDNLKIKNGHGKYLLKKWLEKELPMAKPFRKKQGFTVPVGHWMVTDAEILASHLMNNKLVQELMTKRELANIPAMLKTPETAIKCWPLLYLALWHVGRKSKTAANNIADALQA